MKLGIVSSDLWAFWKTCGGSGIWAQPWRMEIENRLGRRDSIKRKKSECTQGE